MTEEQLHIVQKINTSDLCSIISSRNSSLEDEIRRLKNENKLLGERCNQLLADKGKLTDELDKWKAEWNEQVIKANEEGFARTKQTIQLSKAKQFIRDFLSVAIDYIDKEDKNYSYIEEGWQFLKECENDIQIIQCDRRTRKVL